jgi:hypothetical protein
VSQAGTGGADSYGATGPLRGRIHPTLVTPMNRARSFLPLLLLAAAIADAHAAEPIATDRPDFVESSQTVGIHRVQIETSVAWEQDDDTRTFATPTLLRVGVSDHWELRLEGDGWLRSAGAGERESGLADVSVGAKYHVAGSGEHGPSLAWLLHADLPSGDRAFRGHGVRPSVRLVAEWELPSDYALGVMPGLVRESDDEGRRYTAGILGVVVGKAWTERFRTFAEVALPQIARSDDGGTVALLDLGGAWLLSDDVQLDVAYSAGLTRRSPDHGVTVGLSARF